MPTTAVDNNQFELIETPGKKRRRNEANWHTSSFTDQTFSIPSSTPIHNKQIDGSAFENPSFRFNNKENNIFSESCMEIKSIADLVVDKSSVGENPFEVIRKPPKKKKKQEFEDSCFVNPGLNLNAKENTINPFEVKRHVDPIPQDTKKNHCFVNTALNIKVPEKKESINPFETLRESIVESPQQMQGIENPGLDIPAYAIAVPFTPSVNRRIHFQDVPANALTPCELFAKSLVFTPEPSNGGACMTPKRSTTITKRKSLSVISEEALDIGEELDCYQLELENSINEAKAKKQRYPTDSVGKKGRRSLIEVKHITNLSLKLKQLQETGVDSDDNEFESAPEIVATPEEPPHNQLTFTITKETSQSVEVKLNDFNPDVQYEEVDDLEEDEDFFKNPAPFQRAYRKNQMEVPKFDDNHNFKEPGAPSKSTKVKDVIRRSFRKLMNPKTEENQEKEEHHHGLISTIRHSFRRKGKNPKEVQQDSENLVNISVLDEGPRRVFRENPKPTAADPATTTANTGTSLRSSLRRSTKDVRKQVMKSVFKKTVENYKME